MAVTADIWTEQDRLSTPLWASVALHAGLFGLLVFGGFINWHTGEAWGGAAGGGGAMSATLVSSIPLPSHVPNQNVLANESKGVSQTQPKVEEQPPPEAIPIPAQNAKKAPKQRTLKADTRVSPEILKQANNIVPFGEGGQAGNLYSTFSSSAGTGGVNVTGGDFGSRFSSYVDGVRRRISETWFMYEVDPSAAGRRVYVTFDILRDGSHTDAVIEQGSGVPTLDQSAKRTIARIDRFAPLPSEYNGRSVSVEFYFEYTGKH